MAGVAEPVYVPSKKDTARKKLGSYRIRYVGLDGRRYSITRPTKAECSGAYGDEIKAMNNGSWIPPKLRDAKKAASEQTVGEWLEEWLELKRRDLKLTTFQNYEKTIKNRITEAHGNQSVYQFSEIPLAEFTKADALAWWDAVNQVWPDTPTTNRSAYVRLRSAFEDAVDRERIDFNPVNIKRAGKKPKVRKHKDLPSLRDVFAIADHITPRYRLAFLLTMLAALRVGEVLGVRLEDLENTGTVDEPSWVLHIRHNSQRVKDPDGRIVMVDQTPKGESSVRTVYLMPVLNSYIDQHLAKFAPKDPTDHLFRTRTERPVLYTSYNSCLKRAKEVAGVDAGFTSHTGRYLMTTLYAEGGATLKEIGTLHGQSDPSVILEHYLQHRPDHMLEIMKSLNAQVLSELGSWVAEKSGEG